VSESLLLDTHIALWLDSGNERLRPSTRVLIDQWHQGGSLLLSAVSAWEIALLVDARRIDLDCSVEAWVGRFVDRPGFAAIPLSHRSAVGAYRLHHLEHRDPGDRLLIATAIELTYPLVTYNARIEQFAATHGSRYGLVVSG
jgi:PIN domain nuclease of toxin-antitoxin system